MFSQVGRFTTPKVVCQMVLLNHLKTISVNLFCTDSVWLDEALSQRQPHAGGAAAQKSERIS